MVEIQGSPDSADEEDLDGGIEAGELDAVERDDLNSVESSDESLSLTVNEKSVIESLEKFNVKYLDVSEVHIVLERQDQDRPAFLRRLEVSRSSIDDLLSQLSVEVINYPEFVGFMQPSRGYSEIVLRDYRRPSVLGLIERFVSLGSEQVDCVHSKQGSQLLSVPFVSWRSRSRQEAEVRRVHLGSLTDKPCIEISNASPLAMVFYGRSLEASRYALPTIKIDYRSAVDTSSLTRQTSEIARSLIYELDVRNGRVADVDRYPLPREKRFVGRRPGKRTDQVRYPQIRLQHEVADLFGFASQAIDNPPLSFLSYYQTLEYFIPAAVRQSALKKIRLELRDPTFDSGSDRSLLRIISTAESMVRSAEASQLRTLVREYVRRDRLIEFFEEDWGNHFTHRGPIKGVENINIRNSAKDICDQVADRIYQIRNRIVHAKDDRRYEETPVLLPRSQEAEALGPDIELVRLLAMEAIVAAQG